MKGFDSAALILMTSQAETYITIWIRARTVPRAFGFIAHFLPNRIELAELRLEIVTMLLVAVGHTVHPRQGPV